MIIKQKKLLSSAAAVFLAVSLAAGSVYADAEQTQTQAQTAHYKLSLKDAIDMAIKDNPQITACETEQKSNKINLDAAYKNMNRYKKADVHSTNYSVMFVKKGYYVHSYEAAIRLNDKNLEKIKSNISYNVTQSYFNYKIADSLCGIAQNAYNLAKENYDNVSKRFELGMIAELDLKSAGLNVTQCENTLNSYIRTRDIAKENLKINLQLDGTDCDFELTDSIECKDFSAALKDDTEKAMKSRYDVNALNENYLLAKEYFEIAKPLSESSATYQSAYSDYINKEYSYTNGKKQIALSLNNTYNSCLTAKDSLNTAQTSADIAKQTYDINKVKFGSGMITNTELTKSLNDYLNANISLENAKLTYKLAVEKYGYEISIGL